MKKLFLLFFVLHFVSYGQKADGLEICFEVQKSLKGFAADKEADDVLDEILAVIGAAKNFYLIPCNEINNALALTYKGQRYILYDKDFIYKMNKETSDWSGKFILAHEVGHHINGHTRDFLIASVLDDQTKEKQREEELEADYFAAFVLAKLGASLNEAKLAVSKLSNKDDTRLTHPKRDKRILSIEKGWNKGYLETSSSYISNKSDFEEKYYNTNSWEYNIKEPFKNSNNPFDNNKKKRILTSKVIANIFEDKSNYWLSPSYVELEKFQSSTKLVIEQSLNSENYKSARIFIENLIDFRMLENKILTMVYNNLQKGIKQSGMNDVNRIVLQIILDKEKYNFDCYNNDVNKKIYWELGGKDRVELFLNDEMGNPIKNYDYSNYEKFINNLKSANSAYFKIIFISSYILKNLDKSYKQEVGDDWFNTYYINLKGSKIALSF